MAPAFFMPAAPTNPSLIIKTRLAVEYQGKLPSRDWVEERAQLCREITLPSIQNQTAKGLVWVLMVDPEWKELCMDLFGEPDLKNGKTVLLSGNPDGRIDEDALARIHPDAESYLTLRLDSDDALTPTALEDVERCFMEAGGGDKVLINLARGWVWDREKKQLWERQFPDAYQGPFCALSHVG